MRIHIFFALILVHAASAVPTLNPNSHGGTRSEFVEMLPETAPAEVTDLIDRISSGYKPNEHDYRQIAAGILQNRRKAQRASSSDKDRFESELGHWTRALGNALDILHVADTLHFYSSRTNPADTQALEKLYEAYVKRFKSVKALKDAIGAAVHSGMVAIFRHILDRLETTPDPRPEDLSAFQIFVKKCQKNKREDVLEKELRGYSPIVAANAYDLLAPQLRTQILFRYVHK